MPVSSAAYGGGHWSDSNTHDDNGGAAAAAAASDIFRDFTWYSAMLLSHLFALEHAQLVRDAAAEEARRRTATAHSPQLLMRAAMAAANAPATSTTHTGVAAAEAVYRGDAAASAKESEGTEGGGHSVAAPAEEETQKLSHLTTQHRPHILLGFTVDGVAVGGHSAGVEAVLSDAATRWAAPTGVAGERRSATGAGDSADTAAATILAVFDAFYFPSELFPDTANSDTAGPGGAEAASHAVSTSRPALPGLYSEDGVSLAPAGEGVDGRVGGGGGGGVEHNAADNVMNEGEGCGSGATGGSAGAPRVTPEALREAFHTLLLLGQRCATFALSFHGIVGPLSTEDGAADEAVTHQATDNACYFSSEDESRGGGGGGGMRSKTGELAAMQQAASATLQFMLQLSCSCPCAPLSYAAQLCLAHALAVQPPPRTASGWAARQQLLRFLPTLQPPSRALMTDGTAASGLQHCSVSPATAASLPTPTSAAAGTGSGSSSSSSSSSASNRVPATQYIRAEDPMLWFDASGAAHMTTAQQWWAGQSHSQRPRGACLHAYCGPLPATTALPTVQRLLMEEDQYMGPNGSAAAVLQSVLEAVSTEVTLNARVLPGASSSLVHTSLRRRRGLHGSGSNSSSSSSSASGSQRATGAAAQLSSSPHSTDALLERESSGGGGGSPTFPGSTFGSAPGTVALRAQGAAASTSARLSKAAKRRRALLFALAQSHLLPPTLQLTTSKTLLYGVFTDGGECPSYYMLLSLYPDILRAHHTSLHYVLFEDGPLSVDVRLMVATMAASRHRCEYLVSRFSALLLRYAEEAMLDERDDDDGGGGGDMVGEGANTYDSLYRGGGRHGVHSPLHNPRDYDGEEERSGTHHHHAPLPQLPCRGQARQRWITQGPPARLRAVQHLIAITAHTPWTLNEHDIRAVLAAGWTIPEVFQLVAIVAQVVPLCSFVMGMFVPAEPWTMTLLPLEVVERLGHRAVTEESASTSTGGSGGVGGMVSSGSSGALSGLRRGTNMASEGMTGACPGPATPHYAAPGRTLLGTVASGSDVTAMNSTGGNISNTTNNNNNNMNISSDVYRRYAGEDGIVSEQRIKGGSAAVNPHTLWRSQFTWNEVGATSMEQYYPGAATLMSEEIECFFDVVRQLTKADCVGLMSPDYAPSYAFRSLQLYVQNLLGFMVEDYPYNDINKVLRRPAKWFAQVLTMRPETLTRSEVVRWYVPTTPPTGKPSDMSAESSLVTHQLKREIELLSVVDSAQGGHRGGIESASAHPDQADHQPPTPAEAARDAAEAEALQTALTLQDERVLLLIALATMEARKEGLLHILLRPVCSVLSNM